MQAINDTVGQRGKMLIMKPVAGNQQQPVYSEPA